MEERLRPLFTAVQCRNKVLPSRIILAPINTGFARNGKPTLRLLRFHERRSNRSIGISFVGNVAVGWEWVSNSNTAVLSTKHDARRYAVIAHAIRKHGSLAGLQLAHSPAGLSPVPRWQSPNAESEVARLRAIITNMQAAEIDASLQLFVNSSRLAALSGYDVVQIHGAHGYFLSLLLTPLINLRRDRFGTSFVWVDEFIENLRSVLGETLLSFRLNLVSGIQSTEDEIATAQMLAARLAYAGVDIVDLSAGLYTVDRRLVYPNSRGGMPPYYAAAERISKGISGLVSFAGGILDLRILPSSLPPNLLLVVGRALIADSEFATKSLEGRHDDINWCRRTNKCHYFSRGRPHLECGVNSELE